MPVIEIGKDEQRLIPLLWTGKEASLDYHVNLGQPGASITFLGLLVGKKSQNAKLNISITHAAPHTSSKVIIKSALYDNAQIDIHGLIDIQPGAKGTNAWLAAHVLLLSNHARGQAVPSLEILENDVKAGHATTIGRINDEVLFYLMSRGLSLQTARQVIVGGFLSSILENFPTNLATRAKKELDL